MSGLYFYRNHSIPTFMPYVRPKKRLGQHFLVDENIAKKIVNALHSDSTDTVIEIGPGMGVLTKYLIKNPKFTTYVIEIDKESIHYLKEHFPLLQNNIIENNFLKLSLRELFKTPLNIIGNFPYNIASQIFFKILDYKEMVNQIVCMIQKEVAERIISKPGSKTYGILSVLLQCYYNIEKLFNVSPSVFIPPPKVNCCTTAFSMVLVSCWPSKS